MSCVVQWYLTPVAFANRRMSEGMSPFSLSQSYIVYVEPSGWIHSRGFPYLTLPRRTGGEGSRLRSVRRSGVAGSGRGGKDSAPLMRLGFAGGGPWSAAIGEGLRRRATRSSPPAHGKMRVILDLRWRRLSRP
jgi:hypothetical protein